MLNDSYNGTAVNLSSVNISPQNYREYQVTNIVSDLYDSSGSHLQVSSANVLRVRAIDAVNEGFLTTYNNLITDNIILYSTNESGIALFRREGGSGRYVNVFNYSNQSSADLFNITKNLLLMNVEFDFDLDSEINGFGGNLSFEYNMTDQFTIYVETSVANEITYVGHSDGNSVTANDVVLFNGTLEDISSYSTNTTMASQIIIEAPSLTASSDVVAFHIPDQNPDCSLLAQNDSEGWFSLNITECVNGNLNANQYFLVVANFVNNILYSTYSFTNNASIDATDNSSNLVLDYSLSTIQINSTDLGIPIITINSPATNQWTNDSTPLINFTIVDVLSSSVTYAIFVDGVNNTYNSTTNNTPTLDNLTTAVNDGNHSLYIQATDSSGNSANSSTIYVLTDVNAPYSNINTTNNTNSTDSTPQISFTLNDTADSNLSYRVFVDGSVDVTGYAINNTETFVNLSSLSDGNHRIIVEATDEVSQSTNSTEFYLNTDTTSPVISSVQVNGINVSEGGTVDISTPNATINFTLNESMPLITNMSIDGTLKNSTANNNSLNFNVTLISGKHNVLISTRDVSGNTDTYLLYVRVSQPVNFTNLLNQTQNNLNNVSSINISNGTGDLTNMTAEPNSTFNLSYTINADFGYATATVTNFDGLDADWNQTLNYSLETNTSSPLITTTGTNSGLNITHVLLFQNYSNFINTSDFDGGATFFFNITLGENQSVIYVEDDDGSTIYRLSQCTGNTAPTSVISSADDACYVNGTNLTVYVPHFSGVGVGNDTAAPTITLLSPADLSTEDQGFFNLNFTVNEYNPETVFCTYNISTGNTNYLANITTSNMSSSGTTYTYNGSFINQLNAVYGLNITCYDQGGRSSTSFTNYTVADSTAPYISSITTGSVDETDFTINWNTNELSNRSVQYGNTTSLGSNAGSNSFTSKGHSQEISSLSAGTTYYFNVTSCDINGNCNTSGPNSEETDSSSSGDDSSSGGDGGDSSSSSSSSNDNTNTTNTTTTTTTSSDDNTETEEIINTNTKTVVGSLVAVDLQSNDLLTEGVKELLQSQELDFESFKENTELVGENSVLERKIVSDSGSTTVTTSYVYSGVHKIKKLILHNIVPKEFAQTADEITVESEGTTVVINPDPEFATILYDLTPGKKYDIKFTVEEEKELSIVDSFGTNIVVPELELVDTSTSNNDSKAKALPWIIGFIVLVGVGFLVYYYYMKEKQRPTEDRILHLDDEDEDKLKQLSHTPVEKKKFNLLEQVKNLFKKKQNQENKEEKQKSKQKPKQ